MYLHFFQLGSIFTITVKNYPRTVHTVLNRNFIYKIYQHVKNFLKITTAVQNVMCGCYK